MLLWVLGFYCCGFRGLFTDGGSDGRHDDDVAGGGGGEDGEEAAGEGAG